MVTWKFILNKIESNYNSQQPNLNNIDCYFFLIKHNHYRNIKLFIHISTVEQLLCDLLDFHLSFFFVMAHIKQM